MPEPLRIVKSEPLSVVASAPVDGAPGEASPGTRFAENVWSAVNPMNVVQAALHPVDTLGALVDAHLAEASKTKAMYDAGRYSEAAGHLGATLLPVLGPAAARAGEQIGSGDIAGGLGSSVGLLASTQVPKVIGRVGTATGGALRGAAGDVVGAVSPRLYHAARILDAIRQGLGRGAAASDDIPAPANPTAPHLDRSVPVQAGALSAEELAQRIKYGTGEPTVRPPVYAPRPTPGS